jgi:hypothetical protein
MFIPASGYKIEEGYPPLFSKGERESFISKTKY